MKANSAMRVGLLVGALMITGVSGVGAQMTANDHAKHGADHATEGVAVNPVPALPGQDAFGAIQEIVAIMEADPSTDWSRANVGGLRAHLVDMNRLVMEARVEEQDIDGGLRMTVTGDDQTLASIQAMVPAHAPTIDGMNGWTVTADSAILTVSGADDEETAHIRGLGFYGLMVTGSHHSAHHLGLAQGDDVHAE